MRAQFEAVAKTVAELTQQVAWLKQRVLDLEDDYYGPVAQPVAQPAAVQPEPETEPVKLETAPASVKRSRSRSPSRSKSRSPSRSRSSTRQKHHDDDGTSVFVKWLDETREPKVLPRTPEWVRECRAIKNHFRYYAKNDTVRRIWLWKDEGSGRMVARISFNDYNDFRAALGDGVYLERRFGYTVSDKKW